MVSRARARCRRERTVPIGHCENGGNGVIWQFFEIAERDDFAMLQR